MWNYETHLWKSVLLFVVCIEISFLVLGIEAYQDKRWKNKPLNWVSNICLLRWFTNLLTYNERLSWIQQMTEIRYYFQWLSLLAIVFFLRGMQSMDWIMAFFASHALSTLEPNEYITTSIIITMEKWVILTMQCQHFLLLSINQVIPASFRIEPVWHEISYFHGSC